MRLLLLLALVAAVACAPSPQDASSPVTIFAAASLRTALDDVDRQLLRRTGITTRLTYAGTPQLARQVEAGAPADLFIAADDRWMDVVVKGGHVRAESRVTLLANRLVLIAPRDGAEPLTLGRDTPLRRLLHDGRLAIADPESVPAGRYARQALTTLGLWPQVADRLAPHEHVRAALAIVAAGEAPLGIVYRSDAIAEPKVRVIAAVEPGLHAPIRYPAALTRTASPRADAVLAALRSAEARAIFAQHGFEPPPS